MVNFSVKVAKMGKIDRAKVGGGFQVINLHRGYIILLLLVTARAHCSPNRYSLAHSKKNTSCHKRCFVCSILLSNRVAKMGKIDRAKVEGTFRFYLACRGCKMTRIEARLGPRQLQKKK